MERDRNKRGLGLVIVSLQPQNQGEIIQANRDILVFRAVRFLENCQRAPRRRRCFRIVSPETVDGREVVENPRNGWILGAERFFQNPQGSLEETFARSVVALLQIALSQTADTVGEPGVGPSELFCLRNGGLELSNRFRRSPLLESPLARIVCSSPTIRAAQMGAQPAEEPKAQVGLYKSAG